MKKIITTILMGMLLPAYAQNALNNVKVEVTETSLNQNSKVYLLEGHIEKNVPFIAKHTQDMPISGAAKKLSGYNLSMLNTNETEQYLVEVKDLSSYGYSNFDEDDSFIAQKIKLTSHETQEVVVSKNLKFKITVM